MNKKENIVIKETILDIKRIEEKKYITIKEFDEIYNISVFSQQQFRGRLNDPLPYH